MRMPRNITRNKSLCGYTAKQNVTENLCSANNTYSKRDAAKLFSNLVNVPEKETELHQQYIPVWNGMSIDCKSRPALMKHTSIKMNNENYMVDKSSCVPISPHPLLLHRFLYSVSILFFFVFVFSFFFL